MAPLDGISNGAQLPPFPDNVPIAPLLSISFQKLVAGDQRECQRLIQACESLGFFYLDLRQGAHSEILDDVNRLFQVTAELFALPLAEKQKYDFNGQRSYFGYKPQGVKVVDDKGNVDRNENYNVPRDNILGIIKTDELPAPEMLRRARPTFRSMMRHSHAITTLLLDIISTSLGLPRDALSKLHRIDAPSGDLVRLIKAPAQPAGDRRTALPEHTDYGSITLVFNRLGGLQVFTPPGPEAEWLYVKPLPGHAVVNIGDALVKFTNGLLRSNLHRIHAPPGDQATVTRYSLLYFSRPEDDVLLQRLKGESRIPELAEGVVEEQITAKDWILRRGLGRGDKTAPQPTTY